MKKSEDTEMNSSIRVREIRLGTEESEPSHPERERGRNTELVIITYMISAMFVLLVGYMGWLNIGKRNDLQSNIYNTKQDTSSDRIIRGSIITEKGTVLASSSIDYTGNEIRYYPYANIFAHTIGYATNGKGGLEASENGVLMNSHSSLLDQLKNASDNTKVQGDNVVVTLDPTLQQAAYYALGSYKGAVVVMEPDSGKILAMVSKPDFDPNTISSQWENLTADASSSVLLNRATQGLYPPGSTFKILTALAYLQQKGTDEFYWNCQGTMTEDEVLITCYNSIVHGEETLRTAFANSCNTAFASIGLGLDCSQFRKLAENFMFNNQLPTDLQHSESSFVLNSKSSVDDIMTTSIGQGETLVTPLHMAMITSTVANGGIMMKPYMVARTETYDGQVVTETKPEIAKTVMTVDEAEKICSFMKATVSEGTGAALSYNSYSVAGKTGSAEYETNGQTGTHSWFVGFSNVDDPDIVVVVIAEDGGTGSSTAVPIAQQIFDAYYWG